MNRNEYLWFFIIISIAHTIQYHLVRYFGLSYNNSFLIHITPLTTLLDGGSNEALLSPWLALASSSTTYYLIYDGR